MKSVKIRCETTCLVAAVKFQKVQKFKKTVKFEWFETEAKRE